MLLELTTDCKQNLSFIKSSNQMITYCQTQKQDQKVVTEVDRINLKLTNLILTERLRIQSLQLPQGKTQVSQKSKDHSQISLDLSRLREQEKQRRKRLRHLKKQVQQKNLKRIKEIQEQERVVRERRQQEKRMLIQENLKRLKQRQKQRSKSIEEANKRFEQVRLRQPLHSKLHDKFVSQHLVPQVELRKKVLQERREKYSFSIQQILSHQKQYKMLQQLRPERDSSTINEFEYRPSKGSVLLRELLQNEHRKAVQHQQNLKIQKQLHRKKKSEYAQLVKQHYAPKLVQRNSTLPQDKPERKTPFSSEELKQKGNQYLKQARRKRRSMSKNEQAESPSKREQRRDFMLHIQQEELNNLRGKRIDRIKNMDFSIKQKLQLLKAEEQLIARKLKQKQKLLSLGSNQKTREEATQLLLMSIRAKRNMLALAQ